jgi:WD40 repeat protein
MLFGFFLILMDNIAQHYQTLGLALTASPEEIKQAYLSLAKVWHPDRFLHDPILRAKAEQEIKKINQAYQAIKDSKGVSLSFEDRACVPHQTPIDNDNLTPKVSAKKRTPESHYLQGVSLAEAGNLPAAIIEFSLAIKLNPNYLEAYQDRGLVFSKLGYEQRANSDLQKAAQLKMDRQVTNRDITTSQSTKNTSENNNCLGTIMAHQQDVCCLAISHNGKLFASGSRDKTIKLWELKTFQIVGTLTGHRNAINCLLWMQDNRILISGSQDKTIKFWDLAVRKNLHTFGNKFSGHSHGIKSLAIDVENNHLLSGDEDKTLKIWDLRRNKQINQIKFAGATLTGLAITQDCQFFCSGELEKQLRIRTTQDGKVIRSIRGDAGVLSLAFSPDGNLLATGGFDCKIKIWDVTTGQAIYTLEGHGDRVAAVAFSPDGKFLISGSWDKTIKLWKLNNGQEINTFVGHTDKISCVAIAPNNQTIISGSADCTIKIWQPNF